MNSEHFHSINPANGKHFDTFEKYSPAEIDKILYDSGQAFTLWSKTAVNERAQGLSSLADELDKVKETLSERITLEMGKPISQAKAEVEKCALLCRYYAENAADLLRTETVDYGDISVDRRYDPVGAILGIMPWNYPIWQAMRYAIPAIAVGNTVLLKPAPNVIGTAIILEKAILDAIGVPGLFRTIVIDTDHVESVIASHHVRGVTFTGSDKAGAIVAALAGKYRKKSVLELGGSDPFIVLDDADIEAAGATFVQSRMNNTGQTCIAAKRAIVHSNVMDTFLDVIKDKTKHLVVGEPMDENTEVSCIARKDLCDNLVNQVDRSSAVVKPAFTGGRVSGTNFYHPEHYIIQDRSAALWREEIFGPVGAIHSFGSTEEAVSLANDTRYGLGCSIWSKDLERAKSVAAEVNAGSIHINRMVSSDPRVPFGGVKDSGYGRELGDTGLYEFANEKLISY